jgi:hypothetical protein
MNAVHFHDSTATADIVLPASEKSLASTAWAPSDTGFLVAGSEPDCIVVTQGHIFFGAIKAQGNIVQYKEVVTGTTDFWSAEHMEEDPSAITNLTAAPDPPVDLEALIRESFKDAVGQYFEDGVENDFSREIIYFIKTYGKKAIEIMSDLIRNEKVDAEVASESLRWIAVVEHPTSYEDRRQLLEQSLLHSSILVRDAAALGLASLDDPHGIPALTRAIEREKSGALRKDMEVILAQLEAHHSATSPQENP